MRGTALLVHLGFLGILTVACASSRATGSLERATEVHPEFGTLRPVTAQVRVEGVEKIDRVLAEEIHGGLIAKGYSVLVRGVTATSEVGILRARIETRTAPFAARVSLEDPFGTVIYRCAVSGAARSIPQLAAALLEALPRKR